MRSLTVRNTIQNIIEVQENITLFFHKRTFIKTPERALPGACDQHIPLAPIARDAVNASAALIALWIEIVEPFHMHCRCMPQVPPFVSRLCRRAESLTVAVFYMAALTDTRMAVIEHHFLTTTTLSSRVRAQPL